jgi:serine carboxypeptidase-like clade 2
MKKMTLYLTIFLILAHLRTLVSAANDWQKITTLPGLTASINFTQYAGYINIGEDHGQFMFYWFVESQNDPKRDPLLLWLNGGPGASSLIGFFTENGPFRPDSKLSPSDTLSVDPFAWNRVANVIYLESPLGVGFSFSDYFTDYYTDDNFTAWQNYKFLLKWFEAFPEFKSNDFYISGESYGGHYIPTLANLILDNAANNQINMKGFLVGNPSTDNDDIEDLDEYNYVTYMYSHGLIPQGPYVAAVNACGWTNFLTDCSGDYEDPTQACQDAVQKAINYVPSNIDPYDIYAPPCPFLSKKYKFPAHLYTPALRQLKKYRPDMQFDPCLALYLVEYLNRKDVQQAIHVQSTWWIPFGSIYYSNSTANMMPLYQKFCDQASNWRILVFSGEADSVVSFIGTERWINCLGRPITKDFRAWYYMNQTAGTVQDFDCLTFLTIKGVGHMVPYYNPELGYEFFVRWIQKRPF